jgi:hypothetical protein
MKQRTIIWPQITGNVCSGDIHNNTLALWQKGSRHHLRVLMAYFCIETDYYQGESCEEESLDGKDQALSNDCGGGPAVP